jgi:pyrimidine deaminase RibD-like protein
MVPPDRERLLSIACGRAIEEGHKARAKRSGATRRMKRSESNPDVGAVILDSDYNVLATSHRHEVGSLHAEVGALSKVAPSDRSLIHTLVTTLEPCSFRSRGPSFPCANMIVRAKVAHVVLGSLDPAIGVRGYGAQILQDHGVRFSTFPEEYWTDVKRLNEPYIGFRRAELEKIREDPFSRKNLDVVVRDLDRIIDVPSVGTSPSPCSNAFLKNPGFDRLARRVVTEYDASAGLEFRKFFALRCRLEETIERVLNRVIPSFRLTVREALLTHLIVPPGDDEGEELYHALGGWVFDKWGRKGRKKSRR